MISIKDLREFAEAYITQRPLLENFFIVGTDDELNKLFDSTVNNGNNCSLVVLIPTHDGDSDDEDNRRLRNNLYFMVIKKTDAKKGHEEKIRILEITQEEIKQLAINIFDIKSKGTCNGLFSDAELNTLKIDPVLDYLKSNGWEIEISSRSQF